MAITRSQQAKQLLAQGGRTGFQGGGADMGTVSTKDFAANKDLVDRVNKEQRKTDELNRRIEDNRRERERQRVKDEIFRTPIGRNRPLGPISLANAKFQRNMNINLARKRAEDLYERLEDYVVGDTDMDYDFSGAPKGLATLTSNRGTSIESTRPNLYTVNPDISFPSILGAVQGKIRPDTQVTLQNTLDKARDYTSLVNDAENMTNQEIKDALTELQNRGKTPDQINPPREDRGGVEPIIPVDTTFAQTPIEEEDYYASVGGNPFENQNLKLRFRAEGGPIGVREDLAEGSMPYEGGIMDLESARQMYGLGKLVKKVTRTVKKIAKSPIGKIAIGAAIGNFAPTLFGKGTVLSQIKGAGGLSPFLFGAPKSMIAGPIQGLLGTGSSGTMGLLGKLGLTKGAGSMALTGKGITSLIGGASMLAGLLTPAQEEEAQELARGEGIDIEAARNAILAARREQYAMDSRARRFKAEGGRIGLSNGGMSFREYLSKQGLDLDKLDINTLSIMQRAYDRDVPNRPNKLAEGGKPEPVAKKTMPLLDMGGKEMDLREDGGFVPIGRMEKADDVPARLSKNEFVFTADAVRNAGDGDVDKGAEVMYNMMKNLESGGDVSEESQGLEGARKMFQTSQRLEEVL